MEPTIRKTWTVRVVRLAREPAPGDVVVIRGSSAFVIHRVVAIDPDPPGLVYHRGDAMGRIGACRREDVIGRAVALVDPLGPLPDLAPGPLLEAFAAAQRRCRRYIRLRRVSSAARLPRSFLRRFLSRCADRLLLH